MGSFGYDLKAEMRVWLVEFQGLGGFRLRWACRMEFYECGAVSEHCIDDILVFSSLCFRFLLKTPCKVELSVFSPYYQCSPPFFCLVEFRLFKRELQVLPHSKVIFQYQRIVDPSWKLG